MMDIPRYARPGGLSRSFSPENPMGGAGAGGAASSNLGPGKKGRGWAPLAPGETLTLLRQEGGGIVRRIWLTVPQRTKDGPVSLLDLRLRMFWDGASAPAVDVPVGDFFCDGFSARTQVLSVPIVNAPVGGLTCYFEMPFRTGARIELVSESPVAIATVFYQVDVELGEIPDGAWSFHATWASTGRGTPGEDHEILRREGASGAYVGTYLAFETAEPGWFGEGEVKFYLDGDTALPTICGTGTEDYGGGAWGYCGGDGFTPAGATQIFSAPFFGYPYDSTVLCGDRLEDGATRHALYRWHLPDPVRFESGIRAVVQRIGLSEGGLFVNRSDSVRATAYWYES